METPDSTTTGRLAHPLPTLPNTPTNSGYGMRFHPVHQVNRMHHGVDMRVAGGTRIGALDGGEVMFAGTERSGGGEVTGAGNYVIVRHGTQDTGYLYSASFHAQDRSTRVVIGSQVTQGQTLALVGRTGTATGNHLHLEIFEGGNETLIRQGSIGGSGARRLNPSEYIGREYLSRITIRQGDRNDAVEALQQHLVDRGYDLRTPGQTGNGVDGSFGGATQTALAAFPRDRGMTAAQQTGVYERVTQAPAARTGRLRRSLARAWSAALGAALAVTAGACTQPASAPSAAASDTSGRVPDVPAANAPRARPAPGAGLSVGDPLSADLVACLPAGAESDAWAMTGRAEDGTDVYVHAERVSLGGTTDYDPVLLRLRDSACDGHFVYETDSGSDSDARPPDEAWKALDDQSFAWHVTRAGGVEALADVYRAASEGQLVACQYDDDMDTCVPPRVANGFIKAGIAVEPHR